MILAVLDDGLEEFPNGYADRAEHDGAVPACRRLRTVRVR